jgi:D-alanine-D-alanine ligase
MKKNIAIVAGGDSGEYEISINSAVVVKKHLDPDLFNLYPVHIKGAEWYYVPDHGNRIKVNKEDFSISLDDKIVKIDCVFIAIHGTPGEDGKLQGYFDLLRIPYTSCGQATSALTFNKYFCNRYVSTFGVKISRSIILDSKIPYKEDEILEAVSLPCFVKPNCGGSSVGTSRVSERSRLADAIRLAFKEDDQVMIEQFIPGREITCGVITHKGRIRPLPLTEIVSKKEFFDYDAKYRGMAEELTPAPVPDEIAAACRETSVLLYEKLNCKGMVRFDYIFNNEGLVFLEANTVPGLSEASIVPKQALAEGISLRELFTEAVLNALNNR